jgi:outer membrane receptor protein involved in Fe transport
MTTHLYSPVVVCLTLLLSLQAAPQTNIPGAVRGSVIDDSTKAPLEFVNVLLLNSSDSTLVTGTVTQPTGKFDINHVPWGDYFIKCEMVGYHEKMSAPFRIDSLLRRLNVGTISLFPTAVDLSEVTVTADRPQLEHAIDRMIYHVGQDITSKTASASELLENIPSVQVDLNGEVSLRGSKRVLIMINGKRSPVLEKQEGTFLEQLPASTIEKIEVITSPSAKYRAEGKSGIINIVLKKDTQFGTHGDVTAHAGTGGRGNGSIRLNHSPGDFSVYGSYSLRRDNRDRVSDDVREIASSSDPSLFSTYSDDLLSSSHPVTQLATIGFEVRLDELNSVALSGSYFQNSFTRTDTSHRTLANTGNIVISTYDRNDEGYEFDKEKSVTASYHHNFSRPDHKLQLDVTSSGSPETDDYRFTNSYLSPPFPTAYDNSFISQRDDKNQVSVEYSNALSKKSLLEAGYTGEFSRNDLTFYTENFDALQNGFVKDPAKSSEFGFHESIHSWYSTYKQSFGTFGFLAGIRIEEDSREADLRTVDSVISYSFLNLFPSLHLSYAFTKAQELKVSYSRRISRPKARELDPFPEYRDPRNISFGNPHLVPEYIHSLELGFQFHEKKLYLFPSLFYRSSSNGISPVKKVVNRSTLQTTKQNVQSEQSVGLELIASADIGDLISVNASATGFYEELDATALGEGFFKSRISWNGTLTMNLKVTKSSRVEIHSHVNSLRLTPQGEYFPSSTLNVGFRQEFLDGKLSAMATVTDLYKDLKRHYELDVPGLQQTIINTRESRIFFVGLTFRMGSVPKKPREDEFHYEDDE